MNRGDLYKLQTDWGNLHNSTYNGVLVANRGTAAANPVCMEARLGQTKQKKSQKENLHVFVSLIIGWSSVYYFIAAPTLLLDSAKLFDLLDNIVWAYFSFIGFFLS